MTLYTECMLVSLKATLMRFRVFQIITVLFVSKYHFSPDNERNAWSCTCVFYMSKKKVNSFKNVA